MKKLYLMSLKFGRNDERTSQVKRGWVKTKRFAQLHAHQCVNHACMKAHANPTHSANPENTGAAPGARIKLAHTPNE